MSAELIALEGATFRSVPESLRRIADDLPQQPGSGLEAVLVVRGPGRELEVYGLGYADAGTSHLLLHAGMLKLANTLL